MPARLKAEPLRLETLLLRLRPVHLILDVFVAVSFLRIVNMTSRGQYQNGAS